MAYLVVFAVLWHSALFGLMILFQFYHYFQIYRTPGLRWDPVDILYFVLFYATFLLPLIVVMRLTAQSRASIGVNSKDLGRMLALGLVLSGIAIASIGLIVPFFGFGFTGLTASTAYALVAFGINGPSEEVVWRGFVQTRLVAYHGAIRGVIVTSLFFALWHIPVSYVYSSGVPLGTLLGALLRFPLGVGLGYIMLRSQNVVPSSIVHTFYNWVLELFNLARF